MVPKKTAVLVAGPERGRSLESRPLAAVSRLHREASQRSFPNGVTGVPVAELARAAVKRYGTLKKFTETEVMPALAARGLYRREGYRVLGIFPASRWTLTPTGQAARAELEGTARLGERSFGEWVDREPSRALAFLGVAGPSILLMDALHPDLQRLREEQAMAGYAGYYGGAGDAGGDAEDSLEDYVPDPGALDPGALDFSALDLDFGAALDAIDAGVDAGEGGDGGGGDGGGGGNGGGGGG